MRAPPCDEPSAFAGPRWSSTVTTCPARARASADAAPIAPAPTTTTRIWRVVAADLLDSGVMGGERMTTKLAVTIGASLALALTSAAAAPAAVHIKTLSNRADLIYGGDVLVRVTAPAAKLGKLKITAAGQDVTSAFTQRGPGRLEGVVGGLRVGRSALIAKLPGGAGARLVVTNHPTGGPIFSGPQLQPWPCEAGATDA